MKTLETLGIKPGNDEKHAIMANIEDVPAADFFEQAERLLDTAAPLVLDTVVRALENYPGRWNPGGFIVFPLGLHSTLGSLRLHVWPAGFTRETAQGPNIHNHAWHLASRILVGRYTDRLYQLETQPPVNVSESNLTLHGFSRLFTTRRNGNGQDDLLQDGRLVRPVPILDRSVPAGQTHTIEAGVYHITTIPVDELAATLVVDSPAFAMTTHVLLNDARSEIDRKREIVDATTVALTKEQLLYA